MKKAAKIILIIAIVAAAGTGIYTGWQYLSKTKTSTTKTPGQQNINVFASPKKISDANVFDYWINKTTKEIYYVAVDGTIYKIDSASVETKDLGTQAIGNLSYIKPSNDGSSILVAFGYPQNPTFAIHNLGNKSWQSLPVGTTAAAWDPKSNNRLAYLKDNGTVSRLYLLTVSTQKSQEIFRLTQKDLDLEWLLKDVIYFKERPADQIAGSIWSYNLKTKIFGTLAREELGLSVKWSADGKLGIKRSNNSLSLIDSENRNLGNVDFKTLPNKCVFGGTGLYCATPDNQESLKPNDNIQLVALSNLGGQASLLTAGVLDSVLSGTTLDIAHPEIQNSQLLFINRYDNKLYQLGL